MVVCSEWCSQSLFTLFSIRKEFFKSLCSHLHTAQHVCFENIREKHCRNIEVVLGTFHNHAWEDTPTVQPHSSQRLPSHSGEKCGFKDLWRKWCEVQPGLCKDTERWCQCMTISIVTNTLSQSQNPSDKHQGVEWVWKEEPVSLMLPWGVSHSD